MSSKDGGIGAASTNKKSNRESVKDQSSDRIVNRFGNLPRIAETGRIEPVAQEHRTNAGKSEMDSTSNSKQLSNGTNLSRNLQKSTSSSATSSHRRNSLIISSQAIQKNSLALASLGINPNSGNSSAEKTDVHIDGSNLDSVLGGGVVVPSKPAPPAERPQVWTKSTSRGADDVNGRRMSMPAYNMNASLLEGQKRQSLANIQTILSKMQTQLRLSTTEEDPSQSDFLIKKDDSLFNTSVKFIQRQASTQSQPKKSLPASRVGSASLSLATVSDTNSMYDSKTSLLVNNLMKNIDSLTKPLRGPILLQFAIMYVAFLAILLAGWGTRWAPNIVLYTTFIYFAVAIVCAQLGRMAYARNIDSVIPIYISIIPFATLIFVSREAHANVFVIWLVFTGIIFLQSGHPFLRKHLIYYYCFLIVTYIADLGLLAYFHRSNCERWTCGDPMSPPISISSEAVLIADCLVVMMAFLSLEEFIKLNAATLLERDTFMNQLVADNEQLKKQLNGEEAREAEEVDLEAPLLRATQILTQIKQNQSIDRMIKDEVDFVIGILSKDADNLFKPDLYQEPADADVHDWLNDMMLADKAPDPNSSLFILPEKSTLSDPTADMPLKPADSKVFELMSERLDDPEFDIFEITDLSQGKPLYYIGWFIFRKIRLAELTAMNEKRFRKWLRAIETGYLASNPYHNASHAADVTHSMYYYVTRPRIWDILKPEEKVAVIIAPIIHDYNHPGKNNAFLISTTNTLAIRYNDLSVLEHFHVSSVYELMNQDEYDIFANFSPESRKLIREMTICMVLSTDMAVHFDWIGKFKNKVAGAGFDFEQKQDRKLLLNMAMKCADINNPSKKLKYCRKWTQMIMDEFFKQGDEEKRLGLKVSMFMDRDTTEIPKCQVGFIEFIVQPLYEAWAGFMKEDVARHQENIAKNKAFWKSASENPAILNDTS